MSDFDGCDTENNLFSNIVENSVVFYLHDKKAHWTIKFTLRFYFTDDCIQN